MPQRPFRYDKICRLRIAVRGTGCPARATGGPEPSGYDCGRGAKRLAVSPLQDPQSGPAPNTIERTHDSVSKLPASAIDVIHRVVTDPGRLTEAWFAKTMGSLEITDEQYVEIVGVIVTVISIDSFCRGVGVPLHPLPHPEPGEPSHYRPATAQLDAAWVPMIPAAQATGLEADLWGAGRVGNVIRALSLVPDAVRQLMDLSDAHYIPRERIMDFAYGRSLSRAQMELIAGRVSSLRGCFY